MTPSSEQPIPIPAAAFDQDRPVGLFYRLKVDLMGGGRLEVRTLLFLAGDRITRTFPFGGGSAFDPSRCNPDMCGNYRHETGWITVRWDDGRVDQWPYGRTAEGFELDGDSFKPARPLTGADLIGTWAGAGNVGVSSENVYTFDPGGTFTFGAGQSGVGGRYHLDGLTLSLAFVDGSQAQRTLFAAGSGEPVGLVCVEGDVYRRQ
ncbi:MAG TPA: hypothetical protein VFX98_11295 [Longimicrobiaceae bacterium]|nr:hypothetical protein [Longimicrobiaceae bacterium]